MPLLVHESRLLVRYTIWWGHHCNKDHGRLITRQITRRVLSNMLTMYIHPMP